jgi:hypothetical protein
VKIEVIYSVWGAEGEEFAGGVHEIEKPTVKFLKLAAAAEAAGVIKVLHASAEERQKLKRHVQSQAAGEAALEKALASGEWHEANLHQFIADADAKLAGELPDDVRAYLETGVRDAKQMADLIAEGASYDEAADQVKAGV